MQNVVNEGLQSTAIKNAFLWIDHLDGSRFADNAPVQRIEPVTRWSSQGDRTIPGGLLRSFKFALPFDEVITRQIVTRKQNIWLEVWPVRGRSSELYLVGSNPPTYHVPSAEDEAFGTIHEKMKVEQEEHRERGERKRLKQQRRSERAARRAARWRRAFLGKK